MDIFCGIDGTGDGDNVLYRKTFENSFVHTLFKTWDTPLKHYVRGPTLLGWTTKQIAHEMFTIFKRTYDDAVAAKRAPRVFLAGYSRGGLAVLNMCQRFGAIGIPVEGLMLFDAVDMEARLEAPTVPGNVRSCFHARRDPRSRSRTSWGNCGIGKGGGYAQKFFLCTHGGMGGVPWIKADSNGFINEAETPEMSPVVKAVAGLNALGAANNAYRDASLTAITLRQDAAGSAEVRQWMFDHLKNRRRLLVS